MMHMYFIALLPIRGMWRASTCCCRSALSRRALRRWRCAALGGPGGSGWPGLLQSGVALGVAPCQRQRVSFTFVN